MRRHDAQGDGPDAGQKQQPPGVESSTAGDGSRFVIFQGGEFVERDVQRFTVEFDYSMPADNFLDDSAPILSVFHAIIHSHGYQTSPLGISLPAMNVSRSPSGSLRCIGSCSSSSRQQWNTKKRGGTVNIYRAFFCASIRFSRFCRCKSRSQATELAHSKTSSRRSPSSRRFS